MLNHLINASIRTTDRLLDSGERNTRRKRPTSDDVDTLNSWFQNEGFLSWEERKYLSHMDGLDQGHDLLSLNEVNIHSLGRHMVRLLVKISSRFKMEFYSVDFFGISLTVADEQFSDLIPLLSPMSLSWSLATTSWRSSLVLWWHL